MGQIEEQNIKIPIGVFDTVKKTLTNNEHYLPYLN